MTDRTWHVALQPQPDQRLDELMGAEQQGNPRERDELTALVDVTDGIDADRADQQAAAEVSLRREAHVEPPPASVPYLPGCGVVRFSMPDDPERVVVAPLPMLSPRSVRDGFNGSAAPAWVPRPMVPAWGRYLAGRLLAMLCGGSRRDAARV